MAKAAPTMPNRGTNSKQLGTVTTKPSSAARLFTS